MYWKRHAFYRSRGFTITRRDIKPQPKDPEDGDESAAAAPAHKPRALAATDGRKRKRGSADAPPEAGDPRNDADTGALDDDADVDPRNH